MSSNENNFSSSSNLERIKELFDELSPNSQFDALTYIETLHKRENLLPLIKDHELPETSTDEYVFLNLAQLYKGNVVRKLFLEAGISKYLFKKYTTKYQLKEISPGFYVFPDFSVDGPFMFQQKYSKATLALESALDMMQYTDYFPQYTTMYMPINYNFNQILKTGNDKVQIERGAKDQTNELFIYYPGNEPIRLLKNTKAFVGDRISLRKSSASNYLVVTSLEQTIVDIFKPQFHIEEEIKTATLSRYLDEHNGNSIKLQRLAAKEGVLNILDDYLERKLN